MFKILSKFKNYIICKQLLDGGISPFAHFFASNFAQREPMSSILNISESEVYKIFEIMLNSEACNVYSVYNNENEGSAYSTICGAMLTMDPSVYYTLNFGGLPKKSMIKTAIISELDNGIYSLYPSLEDTMGKVIFLLAIAVDHSSSKSGLGLAIFQSVLYDSKAQGYEFAYVEATSFFSQKLAKKFNAKVISEIEYESFKYKGEYPFLNIENGKSIQLLEIDLSQLNIQN